MSPPSTVATHRRARLRPRSPGVSPIAGTATGKHEDQFARLLRAWTPTAGCQGLTQAFAARGEFTPRHAPGALSGRSKRRGRAIHRDSAAHARLVLARGGLGTQRRPYADTLDWLLILGRRHLERTLRSYTNRNRERSHRGPGLTPEPVRHPPGRQRRRS